MTDFKITSEHEPIIREIMAECALLRANTQPADFPTAQAALKAHHISDCKAVPMWWLLVSSPVESVKAEYIAKRLFAKICEDFGWSNTFFDSRAVSRREASGLLPYTTIALWAADVFAALTEHIKPNQVSVNETGEVYTCHEELPSRLTEGFLDLARGVFVDHFGQDALQQMRLFREKYTAFGNDIYAKTDWTSDAVLTECLTGLTEQFVSYDDDWTRAAYCKFIRRVFKRSDESATTTPLEDFLMAAGGRRAYTGFCCIEHRPLRTILNAERQIHCEDGPAIIYRDGTKVWALNDRLADKTTVLKNK